MIAQTELDLAGPPQSVLHTIGRENAATLARVIRTLTQHGQTCTSDDVWACLDSLDHVKQCVELHPASIAATFHNLESAGEITTDGSTVQSMRPRARKRRILVWRAAA